MTEEVFRIVVTIGVVLAAMALVCQAVVAFVFYRSIRALQEKAEPLILRAGPVVDRVPAVLDQAEATLRKAGPVIDKAGPVIERMGPAIDQIRESVVKTQPAVEQLIQKITPVVDHAGGILKNTNQILADNRGRFAEISEETAQMVRTGREQVEHMSDFLRDAGDRAQDRLEQIDRTVKSAVGQVEQVGDAMKRAVMSPVREVNGLAAGISAAFNTLVSRPRRSSVEEATQDEELFI